jgi:hypothetical protein
MTLNEITYNILNLFRGGRSTHNEHISLRQLEFNVHHYRAMLARRDFERNQLISRHLEQDLGCVELVRVDASRCCGFPIGCEVSMSKLPIPRTIRFNMRDGITHISDPTGLNTIPLIDPIAVQHLPWDRFTKRTRKAYMIQDHLFIYNPDGMDTVNIRGVFEDPTDLAKFKCGSSACYDPDSPYPMPADLVQALTEGLIKGTLQLLAMTENDTLNDTMQQGRVPKQKQQQDEGGGGE